MKRALVVSSRPGLGERIAAHLRDDPAVERCELATWATAEALERLEPGIVVLLPPAPLGGGESSESSALGSRVRACAEAGVERLVLVASAEIYEPNNHHTGHVGEERLGARRTGNPLPTAWLGFEEAARSAVAGTATALTVLRAAPVPTRAGKDFWSRLVRRRVAFTTLGFDPSIQLLSPADLAEAVRRAALAPPAPLATQSEPGGETYNVAPAGVVPLFRGLRLAGTWPLPLPGWLQRLARALLAPLGLAAPSARVDYLSFPFTVSGRKIESELGFRPAHSSAQVLRALATGEALPATPSTAPAAHATPDFDDFGMSPSYIRTLSRSLFRFLHDAYWRVEVRDLEHVPKTGPAVLVGIHRGHQPWDGVMMLHLLQRKLGRMPRFLVHPTLVRFPFLAPYMIRCGGLHACQENADWVLERGEGLGVFPEGIRGAFAMYRDAYRLRKFGRDEYVRMALRHGVPLVPFVTVGHAEIFPILGKIRWRWWQRFSEWPFLPITPTMSLLPLPSKWHTRFLEPYDVSAYPPAAADDREVVRRISAEIQGQIQAAIDDMLARRKWIFFGSIFKNDETDDHDLTVTDKARHRQA